MLNQKKDLFKINQNPSDILSCFCKYAEIKTESKNPADWDWKWSSLKDTENDKELKKNCKLLKKIEGSLSLMNF